MAEIGKYNTLRVEREVEFGMYLDGEELGEILIPKRYIPEGCEIDDELEVFIYLDSEDRLIATTEKPYAVVDEIAYLKVASVTTVGAFLEWGLMKDLLVPYREQKVAMEEGKSYIVKIFLDEQTNRIAASSKIEKYLNIEPIEYEEGGEVDLMIYNRNDLGYNAIINGEHMGLLYKNEIFQKLERGQQIKGFIKKLRNDGKIDLVLQKGGYEKVDDLTSKIIYQLKRNEGFIEFNDKSPADKISKEFGVSKKTFKKAIGALYKNKKITIEEFGIRLVE